VWVRVVRGATTDVRIAVGSVGPAAIRAGDAEALLLAGAPAGEVTGAAAEECNAVADANGSEEYKRQLVRVLVGRALAEALERAG
jgi:carbon-monoxide dehydrogenase medium subunit